MNHREAMQLMAVEKYVLNELPPQLRDDFEEHYFDCQECAADVRATVAFLDAAKKELQSASVSGRAPDAAGPARRVHWLWRPAFLVPALVASLLFIAFQNAVLYPRLHQKAAQFSVPEVLPSLSLAGSNSRGGQVPALAMHARQPFLLFLDIPTQERFSTYTCTLYSPSGKLAGRVQVSAEQAKDTISIRIPAADGMDGKYSMLIQGNPGSSHSGTSVDLARYSFAVTSDESKTLH